MLQSYISAATALAMFALASPAEEAHVTGSQSGRPRARDIGLAIGVLEPGPLNAITDVPGVKVGHKTIVEGDSTRTGVTAILPHGGNMFRHKVPAAIAVGNGFGKLIGVTQVDELGVIETPIVLTNTLSAFLAADALVQYMLEMPGNENVLSVNPVVGETNDGYLNDIRSRGVRAKDVRAAITAAASGPVVEGSVGAGTGTRCMGWKGGIGTSSRRLTESLGGCTIGVLVQTNFDGVLTIAGAPVGQELGRYYLMDEKRKVDSPGSCMIVVATDAPLDARQLGRLAHRALLGLATVGSPMKHGSGDYVIAFSTAKKEPYQREVSRFETVTLMRDEALSPLFQAAREATEEAIINSLLRATTVTGYRERMVEAIPIDRVVEICRRHGAIQD